jgi:uncharacterized small protein (DUF1192 family)
MFDENEPTRRKSAHLVGQDVSAMSIAELDETISALRAEIERLTETRQRKSASQAAAAALFRTSS